MITATAFLLGWNDPGNLTPRADSASPLSTTERENLPASLTEKWRTAKIQAKLAVPTHTISLFCAGVLVLGLDSYLFGTISAMGPAVNQNGDAIRGAEFSCAIAWSQGMPASSMLAVGGSILVAGLGWMLAHYVITRELGSKILVLLPGLLTFIVIVTTTLLLVRTTLNYLDVMKHNFQRPPPIWSESRLWLGYWVFFGSIFLVILLRTIGIWRNIDNNPRWRPVLLPRIVPLFFATAFTALLAFAGPVYAGVIAENIGDAAAQAERIGCALSPSNATIKWAVGLCIGPSIAIFSLLALSVPGPNIAGTLAWSYKSLNKALRKAYSWLVTDLSNAVNLYRGLPVVPSLRDGQLNAQR